MLEIGSEKPHFVVELNTHQTYGTLETYGTLADRILTSSYRMSKDGAALFPESERVIYEKAPLVQVICQLRFPQILRIESQLPVEFQERIRDAFPILEKTTASFPQPGLVPPQGCSTLYV